MDGFLIVDKPVGLTSHDVVATIRRVLKQKKVGHTGTLDPFATGVLPVALGDATKTIPFLDETVKEYYAVMCLGTSTDTQDCTGTIISQHEFSSVTGQRLEEAMQRFTGRISQIPPMFSAVKQGGVPLYKMARRGEVVERVPRTITIHSIGLESFSPPYVTLRVACSRGTYVRTLASDLGDALGCGAHLTELRRLMSGPFTIDSALQLGLVAQLHTEHRLGEMIISPCQALSHLPALELTETGARKTLCGQTPGVDDFHESPETKGRILPGQYVRLVRSGKLLAVSSCECSAGGDAGKTFRLLRVFT